jgi:hypothetical protein
LRKDAPKLLTFVVPHLQRAYPLWYDRKRMATSSAESEALVPWKMPRARLLTGIVEALVEFMLCDWRVRVHGLGQVIVLRIILVRKFRFSRYKRFFSKLLKLLLS